MVTEKSLTDTDFNQTTKFERNRLQDEQSNLKIEEKKRKKMWPEGHIFILTPLQCEIQPKALSFSSSLSALTTAPDVLFL